MNPFPNQSLYDCVPLPEKIDSILECLHCDQTRWKSNRMSFKDLSKHFKLDHPLILAQRI